IRDFHVTGVQTCALPISERDADCDARPSALTGALDSRRPEHLLETHRVDNAAVIAWHPTSRAIPQRRIETDGTGIVGPDLDADFFQSGRQRALLEPQQDVSAQSAATLRRLHSEQDQVCRRVAVIHDADGKQVAAVFDHRDIGGPAADGTQDPFRRVAPAEAVFDEVARQSGDGTSIARGREPNGRNRQHEDDLTPAATARSMRTFAWPSHWRAPHPVGAAQKRSRTAWRSGLIHASIAPGAITHTVTWRR